jgi:hypothetical protein
LKKYISILAVFTLCATGLALASPNPDDGVIPRQTFGSVECRQQPLQYFRPTSQCGINIFETSKENKVPFKELKVDWGAAFTQELQFMKHRHETDPDIELANLGWGFGYAQANLYLHAQLAPGIRLQLTTYLSTRHHEDTWVKDGYIQLDESPIDLGPLNMLWQRFLTLKVGHMEINYGDAHFRRSDAGMTSYNPFIENHIMDSFATEIAAEAYLHVNNVMLMGGMTGGEIHGGVTNSQNRMPSFLYKAAYDNQVNEDLRVRFALSSYISRKSNALTLFSGDRGGSHFWGPLEDSEFNTVDDPRSGRVNPDLRNHLVAYQFNPFLKYKGLELFGLMEHAAGRRFGSEVKNRTWNQFAVDAVYRFAEDKLYAAFRYNYLEGQRRGDPRRISVDRVEVAGGWFPLPYMLTKVEYVNQNHYDYPMDDILYKGHFHGVVIATALSF